MGLRTDDPPANAKPDTGTFKAFMMRTFPGFPVPQL
jgi:hypothetical protein